MQAKDGKDLNIETYRQAALFRRIGNEAVRKAQEENRRLGIPNAFSRNGVIYYEMPDGEITREDPFAKEQRA